MSDISIEIRAASRRDAARVAEIYSPYVTDTAISFEETPPDEGEMAARIGDSHLWLVAEQDGGIIGYAYAAPFHRRPAYRWSVEVSIYIGAGNEGRGVGRVLLGELLNELREAGFVNAFAGTTLPNARSVALFESFGFEKVAHQASVGFKRGVWHDVGWWQLRLQEPPVPPRDIR